MRMQKVLKKRKMQQEQMIELARSYATSQKEQIG